MRPDNPAETKDGHTNKGPSENKINTYFNKRESLLGLDLQSKAPANPDEEVCFSTQESTKTAPPELFKKAKECHDKAQEELEEAYKSEEWPKVIKASKSAIAAIEWKNSINAQSTIPITGIGIQIERDRESGETRVLNTIQDSPAEKADIRKGDVITKVNNTDTSGLSLDQTVGLIQGEAGSEVNLTIRREAALIEKKITRAAVSGRQASAPLGREYGMLHYAYFKLEKVEEARTVFSRARREIASEFGASSEILLTLLKSQALLVVQRYPREAESLANEAIEIIEHQDAPGKTQSLWGLRNLASYSQLEAGEYERAAENIDKTLAYYGDNKRHTSSALTERLARNLTRLAAFCEYSNIILTKCRDYSDIAYQMALQHLSPSQSEYRQALWKRAELLSETDPPEAWLPLYKQFIELEEKYENHNKRALSLTALALKLATTEANEAARLQSKAVQLIEEQLGKQSFESLTYQLAVADIYRFGGLLETAYSGYMDVYKRLLQAPGTGEYADGQRLKIYIELAKGLMALGKTELVRTILNKQMEISAKYPEEIGARLALVLGKANYSAFVDRDSPKALGYFTEAEQIFKKLEKSYLEPAGKNQEWAKGIRQNEIQSGRIGLYEDMATLQALTEDYAAASRTITNAIRYIGSEQSTNAWKLKYLYASLSRSQVGQGDLEAAEKSFQKALELSLADKTEASFDESYLLAGGVSGLLNKPEAAYKYFLNFSNARAKNLSAKLWRDLDRSKRIELMDTGLNGTEYVFYNYGDNALYAKAAMYARLNLHGLSAELEQKQASIATADPKAKEIIDAIQRALRRISFSNLSGQEKELLSKEIARKEDLLLRRMPGLTHKPTSIDDVSKSLPSNAVLIEFQKVSFYPRIDRVYFADHPKTSRYIALSLDSQGTVRRFDVGEAGSIDRSIRQAVEALSSGFTDSTRLWSEARALLLEPLREALESKSIIYISPDSEISRFPFTDAEVFNPGNILRHNTQIRIVTTGRDIIRLTPTRTILNKAAVIANPSYSRDTAKQSNSKNAHSTRSATSLTSNKRPTWSALPATDKEGTAVSRLINAALLSKNMANEQAVKNLASPKVLHFASHAFFLEEANATAEGNGNDIQGSQLAALSGIGLNSARSPASQIRSGIVLAGANDPPKNQELDGYLTEDEIARLSWLGTELVVVSGCDSAVGIPRSGDGLYGLRRSIAVAGARSSLLSLWKVDDVATAEFMTRFYARLKAGSARSDALAQTQKEFRDGTAGDRRWKDPYYWAAWQLVGDWGPIKGL